MGGPFLYCVGGCETETKDGTVTYEQFEKWLEQLAPQDRKYLEQHPDWAKEYRRFKKTLRLPKDFVNRSMEILEDGSESET
jgi:hypothetical protein